MERYQVVVVGPPDCGKTVYLASLNHFLGRIRIAPGVAAVVRPAIMANRLEAVYRQIADPQADFPAGTTMDDIKEWRVECSVLARGREFPLLSVSYFDAAGEWFPNPLLTGPDAERWHELIEQADAVLTFLDGDQLRRVLSGQVHPDRFYSEQVDPLVSVLNRCRGPLHVVITKWDLLQGHFTVRDATRQVADWLRPHVDERRGADIVVRLIPVSSLGSFVYLDPRGTVRKRPGAQPAPLNLFVPFQAVLPDLVGYAATADAEAQRAQRARRAQDLSEIFRINLGVLTVSLASIWVWMTSGLDRFAQLYRMGIVPGPPQPRQVTNHASAYRYLEKWLHRNLREFERAHPGSRLA